MSETCQPSIGGFAGVIVLAVTGGVAAGVPRPVAAQGASDGRHWVGTWATALVARAAVPPPAAVAAGPAAPAPPLNFNNQTLRQIVRVSVGGSQVRAVFSNAFGTAPLPVGAASIAVRDKGEVIVPGSSRSLLFGGKPTATIAPGAVLVSDPVMLTIADLADVAVDLYLPGDTAATGSPLAHHTGNGALQTNYVSETGNHAGMAKFPVRTTTLVWHFLSRVEVVAPQQVGAVVAFGDSITDGSRSTPDTNNRWPNHFWRLLGKTSGGVLNAGIGGNRLLSDRTTRRAARFDRGDPRTSGAASGRPHRDQRYRGNRRGTHRLTIIADPPDYAASPRTRLKVRRHVDAVQRHHHSVPSTGRRERGHASEPTWWLRPAANTMPCSTFEAAVRDQAQTESAQKYASPGQPASERRRL
jgi:hypothetical protein